MDEVKEQLVVEPAAEETANETERELVVKFKAAKEILDIAKKALEVAQANHDALNDQLLKLLEDDDKKSSAKYEGIGHVTKIEGQVYASILKGMQDDVLNYLRQIERDDMIKTVVHPATLTAFVNQRLKENEPLPPGVTHYRPKWVNFYPAK